MKSLLCLFVSVILSVAMSVNACTCICMCCVVVLLAGGRQSSLVTPVSQSAQPTAAKASSGREGDWGRGGGDDDWAVRRSFRSAKPRKQPTNGVGVDAFSDRSPGRAAAFGGAGANAMDVEWNLGMGNEVAVAAVAVTVTVREWYQILYQRKRKRETADINVVKS